MRIFDRTETMNFEHIPTPETDSATLRATDIEGGGDFDAVHVQVAKRLERRLTVARETLSTFAAFEEVRKTMGGTTPKSGPYLAVYSKTGGAEITVEDMQRAIDTLTQIAPKP